MAEFIGLYRGQTVSDAELVAICAEPRIVGILFDELLGEDHELGERGAGRRKRSPERLEVVRGRDE